MTPSLGKMHNAVVPNRINVSGHAIMKFIWVKIFLLKKISFNFQHKILAFNMDLNCYGSISLNPEIQNVSFYKKLLINPHLISSYNFPS